MENSEKIYFKEREVARITGLALSTLRNHRLKGCGIPFIKVGRAVRYSSADVHSFMESHKIKTDDLN